MNLTVLGCGDAFGSGGKFFTSFLIESNGSKILLDCGASTIIAMKQLGIEISEIDAIIISHFHGDHFGGIPWLALEAKFVTPIDKPILICGPKNTKEKVHELTNVLYPGSKVLSGNQPLFEYHSYQSNICQLLNFTVEAIPVLHSVESNPHAVKITDQFGKSIFYSGDSSWLDAFITFSKNTDLAIFECFQADGESNVHITYGDILRNHESLVAKNIYLTHLGPDMVDRQEQLLYPVLQDGFIIEV